MVCVRVCEYVCACVCMCICDGPSYLTPTNIDVLRRGKNDHKLSRALADVSVCRQLVELCKYVGL